MSFTQTLQEYIQMINRQLEEYLPKKSNLQHVVDDAMAYSVEAGGKRIRPVLTLEVCRMLGGDIQHALPFACAVEMIHSSSLIHDDLPCMDDDDLRRGKPSCHIAFGEANALLAGDALLLYAFEVMAKAHQTHGTGYEEIAKGIETLSHCSGTDGMVGGQVIDLTYENQQIEYETLRQMHLLKTGALIRAACQLGAIAAKASPEQIQRIGVYAETLGMAFQICDDILDVVGDQQLLGKPVGSDEEMSKTNFITLFGLEGSRKKAAELTELAKQQLKRFDHPEFLLELTDMLLARKK